MDFDEALDTHKENFEPYRALIVLDEKQLRKYVLCWGPHLVRRHSHYPLGDAMPDLWECVTVDYQALADLTGDPLPQVMASFRQVQGLQLVYPDGSVADDVAKVLRKKLSQILLT